ncbi:endolytic transglycosylase MltG [Microvirga arsenatis]|uniref:Endolytic murein transglycosylase n=1 Tax=Microvirga arsenatis TaxID=2692265 RepID=A0ABW9YRL7_9HYPH|nr:endolytic transglycosylase MltG [Microvirga arsenatis]NBJ09831.1 endolytic transglycosylase MltG [Microvirga arsenatis]NBJ22899.1 endolytic transglycosylase MltG [Microvirga arsenatis]
MFGRKKKILLPPVDESDAGSSQPRLAPRSPSEAIKPAVAPPPPPKLRRRRGGMLSLFSGLLTLLVAVAIAGVIGFSMVQQEVTARGPLQSDKVVVIPRNTGTGEIAQILKQEGVIEQPLLFQAYAYMNRQRGQLKAGEFQFKAGTSVEEAIDTLIQGKAILHAVTIPEGLTSEQIVARLYEHDILTGDVTETPREGSLLPDTYKFERGTTRQQIINTMQAAQRQAIEQIWQRRSPDLPIKSPQELVILASIVEKETGRADERTRVAGVFINRLMKRMKLQSDPTIVYGLVGGKGTLGRGILRSEIEAATPYNTYVIEGLPPGPIANPGRAALEAVANPSRTKDLYFVADGTGGHAFAETYEQHQRNVTRWRQIEKSRPAPDANVDRAVPEADQTSVPAGSAPELRGTANAAPGSGARPTGRPGRGFDASEGTDKDPLRNKTFDLSNPKNVPPLRQP